MVTGEYADAMKDHLPEIIGITAGFILAESASAFLAATPTGVGQLAVIEDLREFYRDAEGGIFSKYLPDFEQAVRESF